MSSHFIMHLKFIIGIMLFLTNLKHNQCKQSYKHYTLLEVTPRNYHQAKFLKNLDEKKYINVKFWLKSFKLRDSIQIMVSYDELNAIRERFRHFNLNAKILLPDVQEAFDKQDVVKLYNSSELTWEKYYSLDFINDWLNEISQLYSNIGVRSIGKSAEGRDIKVVEINKRAKPCVIIEGGIHGDEWISVSFVTYMIQQLIMAYKSKNLELRKLAKRYRWMLIPVVNPDGYNYTHNEDRLWRKNRRIISTLNTTCGVDLNRNFDFSFGEFATSHYPEDENYCGPEAFSEPETIALSKFIREHDSDLKMYLSVHAYGQNIIIPYANTVRHLDNYGAMENFAKQAAAKIYSLYGRKYQVGTNFDIFGAKSSGSSANWVKQNFKTEYVFTFSLRDSGPYGYALPHDQILSTCEEALVGLIQMLKANYRKILRTKQGTYSFTDGASKLCSTLSCLIFVLTINLFCFIVFRVQI